MILAYAGRRSQSLGGDPDLIGTRIRRLLAGLQPTAVVGAAADGGDLLVLESALAIRGGPAAHVILPTTRAVFRTDSVVPQWRDRFDAVLGEVERRGGRIDTLELELGETAYRRANQVILERSVALADGEQRSVVLVIASEGEGKMIDDLVNKARLKSLPVLRIDPSVDISARPKCFVAMPFGKKTDPQRDIEVDCNLVYSKVLVPALENAQLNYRRADEEIDSGIVLEPMIEWLADADMVIGDLQTANFNVGWELGLRHLMRRGHTVLIGPAGTTAPFDVAALRHVRYRNDEHGVPDGAAIQAWQALHPYLEKDGRRGMNDSPVGAVMDVQQWGKVRRRTVMDEHWEALRAQLALGRELCDADLMRGVLEDTHELTAEQNRLLCAELGVGLVRLGLFGDAQELLREIVESDPDVLRPEAHLYFAQSLYRPVAASLQSLEEAERVLKTVFLRRPGHPEVRALLGAVAKRRLRLHTDRAARKLDLQLAWDCYRHDYERNLNLYYEGINVVAIGVALGIGYGDEQAVAHARELLPAVRVAARLALDKPDERFWAAATLAECVLHECLLGDCADIEPIRAAYLRAGEERPPEGYLDSTLNQLDLLRELGLPAEQLNAARVGLLQGARRTT